MSLKEWLEPVAKIPGCAVSSNLWRGRHITRPAQRSDALHARNRLQEASINLNCNTTLDHFHT